MGGATFSLCCVVGERGATPLWSVLFVGGGINGTFLLLSATLFPGTAVFCFILLVACLLPAPLLIISSIICSCRARTEERTPAPPLPPCELLGLSMEGKKVAGGRLGGWLCWRTGGRETTGWPLLISMTNFSWLSRLLLGNLMGGSGTAFRGRVVCDSG